MPEIHLPSYFEKQQQQIRDVADLARDKIEYAEAHAPNIQEAGAGELLKWLFYHDYLNPYLEIKPRKEHGYQSYPNMNLLEAGDALEGRLHEAACVYALAIEAYREGAGTKVVLVPKHVDRLTRLLDALHFEEDPINRRNLADSRRTWTPDAIRVDTELGQMDEVHEHTRTGQESYVTDKRVRTRTATDRYTTAFVEEPRLVFGVPSDSLLNVGESERQPMPYKQTWFSETSRRVRGVLIQHFELELAPQRGHDRSRKGSERLRLTPRLANS